jgi:hypothetical protein
MITELEGIDKSCLSRILRLAAPDIPEAILAGRADQSLMLDQLERPLPASWVEQRARILEPKGS